MKDKKGEKAKLNEIITECIYLAKLDQLLKLELISEDEYMEVKKAINSF